MATTTPNYGLRKPANSDLVNVALDISGNMDLLDAHAHSGTYVGTSLKAYGLTDATTDIATPFAAAAAAGIRHIIVPYRAAAWPALTTITLSDRWIEFEPGARISFNHADRGMNLTNCRLTDASFTSTFTGPSSAADNSASGNYKDDARAVLLGNDCVVDGFYQEYAAKGIDIISASNITLNNVECQNLRHYKGWAAAVHLAGTGTSNVRGSGFKAINCDRAFEIEAGASHNTFTRGYCEDIGPNGYTGQPGDYADYTFVLDVHSHVGEGACQNNTYRDFNLWQCEGGIDAIRSDGTNDSDLPRGNVWENITIQGRTGTTGAFSVQVQGYGNKVRNLRMLLGEGVTSRMAVLIQDDSEYNEVEITEATGYALPLVKVGQTTDGRGNRIKLSRVFTPTTGADFLVAVNHPDTHVELAVHELQGTVGYCVLESTADHSKVTGFYSIATGTTGMTQAFRIRGASDCILDLQGVAGTVGILDVYATNSTTALEVNAMIERASGTAINFDSTTSKCRLTGASDLGGGTITDAGTGNVLFNTPYPGVSPAMVVPVPVGSGRRVLLQPGANNTQTVLLSNNVERVSPFIVPNTLVVSHLGAEVTVAGEAGSKYRLAIHADAGGYPGALIAEPTTQLDGTSVSVQEVAFASNVTLTPGIYWVGGVPQSAPTTAPTMRCLGSTAPPVGFVFNANLTANQAAFGYTQSGVTGVPPTFPAYSGNQTTAVARVHFRLA